MSDASARAVSRREEEDQRLIGRVVAGKLRIVEHLGSGSMGRVYRAHHLSLDKDVAIKVLRESAVPDPGRSKRFAREARAASRLSHPNSVAVLDFGEDGDDKLLYIAMEFLEGEDLQELIDRGQVLGVERICHIMVQVLAALAAAHDAGIIHRDMKPSNIVLVKQRNDEGQIAEVVKVCDFGVAKFMSGVRDTLEGSRPAQRVIGTPLYMSPEQAVGDTLDPRTDVYSCGVIMYEMLTGQPPFTAETPMGVLMKHVSEPLQPPSVLVPSVPLELEAIIRWALEKKRDNRPGSARELRNAVRAFMAGQARTLPVLARYGVEPIPGAVPWMGTTPLWQVESTEPPAAVDGPILAAPPPPALRERKDLVADLAIVSQDGPPSIPSRATALRDAMAPPIERRIRDSAAGPPISSGDASRAARTAPPRGAMVPSALIEGGPPQDERGEIFSDDSYFRGRERRPTTRLTMDPGEILLEAPPPRALRRRTDTDSSLTTVRDAMATYLWERFGLSPDRPIPAEGLWLRDARGRELGPCTWSEITRALRMEAMEGVVENVSVSSDQRSWMSARRFVELTGVEAILAADEALPERSPFGGLIGERSTASVFADLTHRAVTGRAIFVMESGRRRARFDIHLERGRPTFVFTNEPHLQLPDLLIAKGVLSEERLPSYLRAVMAEAKSLEEAVSAEAGFDVAQYRAAVMKERLRHLLRWPGGRFALDDIARPASRRAFASSLLSLLPDLVYRTLSSDFLEEELRESLRRAPSRSPDADQRLAAMGLTEAQRAVAERLLSSPRLGDVLPPEGRIRKAYTTMAYVLRESGLLRLRG